MLSQSAINQIKKLVEEFFIKIEVPMDVQILPQKEKTLAVNLKTEEPRILIGERGRTLSEIQLLLNNVLRRKMKIEEAVYLDLDINDYKKKKTDYLQETARFLADEVALTKKERPLPSMSAPERRIIHLALAGRSDITTESVGEEPRRRVVIRPYP